MTSPLYIAQVLSAYTQLADTPDRPSRYDRALARELYHGQVPLETIRHAILLATMRRHYRDTSLGALDCIRSLHYFLPVIRQLENQPLDPYYIEYVERKCAEIPSNME